MTEPEDDESTKVDILHPKKVGRCEAHPTGSMLNPVTFDELSNGSKEVFVEYSGQLYRLSRTRLGKLILTKATYSF